MVAVVDDDDDEYGILVCVVFKGCVLIFFLFLYHCLNDNRGGKGKYRALIIVTRKTQERKACKCKNYD